MATVCVGHSCSLTYSALPFALWLITEPPSVTRSTMPLASTSFASQS